MKVKTKSLESLRNTEGVIIDRYSIRFDKYGRYNNTDVRKLNRVLDDVQPHTLIMRNDEYYNSFAHSGCHLFSDCVEEIIKENNNV